ncbi:MAG: hypothetical protein FD134_438 [Gallionellaceae bacterium]|nr:MAG: hypothetical protein FD134_438 [Gallionellaceae bacterium]
MSKITTLLSPVAAGIALAVFAMPSQAAIVDFQDVISGNCASYYSGAVQSGGFNFTGNPVDSNLFVCNAGVIGSNTTAALINANLRSVVTMAQVGGAAFSLNSFFAGGRNPQGYYSLATSIDILGNLVGGGTVSTSVVLDSSSSYAWAQYSLSPSFSNLSSVTFTAQGNGNRPEFLIDDISINAAPVPAPVPEPESYAMLLAGLGLMGFAARRRSRS